MALNKVIPDNFILHKIVYLDYSISKLNYETKKNRKIKKEMDK